MRTIWREGLTVLFIIVGNLHLHVGGGVLKILVADILRVDGIITADSKDMALSGESSASSGGSGGSIWIETGGICW